MSPGRRHLNVINHQPDERIPGAAGGVEHEGVNAVVGHAHGGRVRVEGGAGVQQDVVELDVKVVVESAECCVPETKT